MASISRRSLLATGGAAALALSAPKALTAVVKPRKLRIAHMTDFHVQPELRAGEGMAKALRHAMDAKPQLLLTGGDLVMDSVGQDEARTKLQWDLFTRVLRDNSAIPAHHTPGNHDMWGWNKKASNTTGSEARWGERWFCETFGYKKPYNSFDFGAWHFVTLDNVFETPDGYNGRIDDEQMEWLKEDLESTRKPTLIVSHIPLLSITPVVTGYDNQKGEWTVGGSVMTKNLDAIRKLFAENPHVKLALSGHMHMVDRVDYQGVTYLCGGAVCGNWWKGPHQGFEPGYRIIDLHDDGKFEEQYHAWGWKPE